MKHTKQHVYIVACADGTLYCGSTNNISRRLWQHNNSKQGARYTAARRPVVLRYTETFPTLSAARKREHAIKQLSRADKMKLFS